jgi:hypothetical protein
MLGYLNFAAGKADARFQQALDQAYRFLAQADSPRPWDELHTHLRNRLRELGESGAAAFRDSRQAEAVLGLVFDKLVPAYREHHADLLRHLDDRQLFQPFLVARMFEAVLAQGSPWEDESRIVRAAMTQLNDFVGYRPIAILETRPEGKPYDHEMVRPVPLFIRGAGVSSGRYHDLISVGLKILQETDPSIVADSGFDLELLDELAFDPRAYDHGHPANQRPNYVFGEWDSHHLDVAGRYRRYVARQITLDALLDRVDNSPESERGERLYEAAAVLAGTILMATGTSGNSPSAHESTTTLANLLPRIVSYRDAFYAHLLDKMQGEHGEHLRREATAMRQPFGGARQHLNQYLARHRAAQLQQRQLAVMFAEMGYPEASKQAASLIPATSVRLLSAILGRLSTGQLCAQRGAVAKAVPLLPEVEDLLRRGIDCGAFADPWNILGFQGLFPLFTAREDSVRDKRIDELVQIVEQIFNLYSRLVSESAAVGQLDVSELLLGSLKRLATWWDRFASYEVSDVRRVHGGETVTSAQHVATALHRWHERGKTTADLAFWREHLEGFQSAKAFALVVEALMLKDDYRAAMGLLMNWLGQAEQVPLEDGEYSFHALAIRWMLGISSRHKEGSEHGTEEALVARDPEESWPLIRRFFDFLEANADEYWQVPVLRQRLSDEGSGEGSEAADDEEESDKGIFTAAYEGVTYHDSADDNQEGSVVDEGEPRMPFDLEEQEGPLNRRLAFLSTVAQLWQIAARHESLNVPGSTGAGQSTDTRTETLAGWLAIAVGFQGDLLVLLDSIKAAQVPEPLGSYESIVDFDRRRNLKEQLLYRVIHSCLDMSMAVGTLKGALGHEEREHGGPESEKRRPQWEIVAVDLERALLAGNVTATRALLGPFLSTFQDEPLLFTSLADGGEPKQILRVRLAQAVLRALVTNLPRIGLLRETYQLLQTARRMEQAHPPQGRGVTEFNNLFQAAYQSVVEAVVSAIGARSAVKGRDQEMVDLLERLTRPFLSLWVEHSQSLQLSSLESVATDEDWEHLRSFIRTYGRDLFHAKFMTLANLRGILHRGVGAYFEYLRDNPDPLQPVRLIDDLDVNIRAGVAERWLQTILQTLIENYEEYKDYNTTTPQSDHGDNLYLLLDFVRLKAGYERHAWKLRPLVQAHEVLARRNRPDLAVSWEEAFKRLTDDLAVQYLARLDELEKAHGMRLRTIADRIQERFTKPLALDRLCALIEPAMREARRGGPTRSFSRLEKELQPLADSPTGVGLDVPQWLRRLEGEVQRVRATQTTIAALAEGFLSVPKKPLSLDELRRQLDEWEQPLS